LATNSPLVSALRWEVLARTAREHHVGRPRRDGIEEAIRREIDDAACADSGDPSDGAGDDQGGEGVVRQVVIVLDWLVMHFFSVHKQPVLT
jgi:hypothetical protein